MDRGRGGGGGGRDDIFGGFGGDPFGGMGGFGGFGAAGHRSLMSNLFGGRDPFDSPFFNSPFGSGNSMFGQSMFGQSMFGPNGGGLFRDAPGFIQNVPVEENRLGGGLVIQEINSDEEEEEEKQEVDEKKENPKKHSRSSKELYVEDPDDVAEERKNKLMQYRNGHNKVERAQPQTQCFSYQSSAVTYGVNGAYYTSSTSRKMGGDGVVIEESKEADTTTGKASHRLSRGIRDKGRSVTRKLNPDGKVDTMQTLHNLDEDELPVFEEAWNGSAKKHLPGWDEEGFNMQAYNGQRLSNRGQAAPSHGWALPSTEHPQRSNPEETGSRLRGSSSRGRN